MRSKELRAKRAQIVANARKLVDRGDGAFDAAMAEADKLMAQITRLERHEQIDRELASVMTPANGVFDPSRSADPREEVAREKRLLTSLLRNGIAGMSEEDRAALAPRFKNAAMGTGGSMSITIAPGFSRELFIAMKAQGGMRGVAHVIQTDTGTSMPFPTMDDRSNNATIIGENTNITEDTELSFSSAAIGSFTYKSGLLLLSLQLLQDSAFDFDTIIRDAIAGRFVRKQNADYTTGGGTTLPRGVVLDAVLGRTGAAGQTTSVIYDDLVELFHAVDPVYRPGAVWMMNDSSVKVVRKLKDTTGRPLWQPSLQVGTPDMLLGNPLVMNPDVAPMAAGAKSILFGNFSNYVIRDTLDVQVLVLRERYADSLQVGYIAFCRSDGRLVSAGSPIQFYANALS